MKGSYPHAESHRMDVTIGGAGRNMKVAFFPILLFNMDVSSSTLLAHDSYLTH